MAQAKYNGVVIAESDTWEEVEGNVYFPPDAVNMDYLEPSDSTYTCPWKGHADYYHVVVNGDKNEDAAWVYPEPKEAAANIKGHFAFWHGVEVTK